MLLSGGEAVMKYTRRIYTISEIKNIIAPIAKSGKVDKVYLFGSYARNEATWKSDIDLLIDGEKVETLIDLGGLYGDLEEGLRKPIDLVMLDALDDDDEFFKEIKKDEVEIYG
jgi:predicted nucleotidyltransferase